MRSFDDFDVDGPNEPPNRILKTGGLVAGVGIELQEKRIQAKQGGHHQDPAIAILNVCGMHQGVQQKALGVYENMALLTLDLLARIIAVRIDPRPPFSALLTLWLSMMAAVGLTSRSANSRHLT
jgi:hypothetical protein